MLPCEKESQILDFVMPVKRVDKLESLTDWRQCVSDRKRILRRLLTLVRAMKESEATAVNMTVGTNIISAIKML